MNGSANLPPPPTGIAPKACRATIVYFSVVTAAFVIAVLFFAWRFASYRNSLDFLGWLDAATMVPTAGSRFSGLPEEDRLLLVGKADTANAADQWKSLWLSAPDNPAFFQQYVEGVIQTLDRVPPELLAEAERIDPDNAYILTLAAACLGKDAQEKESRPWSRNPQRTTPVWTFTDPERADSAFKALREASRKPVFHDHQQTLLRERAARLPEAEDVPGRYVNFAYFAGQTSTRVRFRELTDLLAARAQQSGVQGDAEGFLEIVRLWHWLVTSSAPSGVTLIDHLLTKAMVAAPLLNFRDAARQLGMNEMADRFDELDQRLELEKKDRKDNPRGGENHALIEQYASCFASLTLPILDRHMKSPPVLLEGDLRPGRRAEYAMIDQVHALAAAGLFGLCAAFAALSPVFQSKRNDEWPKRMAILVSLRDRIRIIVLGILLPLAIHFAISRFTPLATHEISMKRTGFIAPIGQSVCLTLGMIALTLTLAGRAVPKRGAGVPFRAGWSGWVAAACAFVAVLIFSVPYPDMRLITMAMVLGGTTALWLLVHAALHVCDKPQSMSSARASLARVLVPVWMTSMFVSTLTLPIHVAAERYWVKHDRLGRIDPADAGLSRFEADVARQLVVENAELLQKIPLPAPR